ncbi:MAG: hypothetical protein ABS79_00220 [Planctomycetes bacterium SCN 63-9]|nr:MAG: hypothetical protein ABS79_00220 [Planctomycetes bacterium SCN 63-9]
MPLFEAEDQAGDDPREVVLDAAKFSQHALAGWALLNPGRKIATALMRAGLEGGYEIVIKSVKESPEERKPHPAPVDHVLCLIRRAEDDALRGYQIMIRNGSVVGEAPAENFLTVDGHQLDICTPLPGKTMLGYVGVEGEEFEGDLVDVKLCGKPDEVLPVSRESLRSYFLSNSGDAAPPPELCGMADDVAWDASSILARWKAMPAAGPSDACADRPAIGDGEACCGGCPEGTSVREEEGSC